MSFVVLWVAVFFIFIAVTVMMTVEITAMREDVCVLLESFSVLEISVYLRTECVTDTETVHPASMSSSVLLKV